MVNLLLANKADVNAVDNEGHSVVHWATVCGEIEALRSVLQAGASVTKPDINGGSPLHYAAQMCGAHYEGKLNQATSSKLALEILAILLNHPQSSVDVTDKDGRQPLLWAASAGSAKAVIALVKAGARVESSDKDGLTALHCAASRGHTECIDTLISLCGAPTDLIDSNGCTALHYAVTLGHADATSRLLDLEADPNRQDRKGRTPAHCGCAKGQLETVKMLKERGANLWLRNAKGDLPLHEAASSGRRELVEWLLDQRPKQVNTTSNDGRTMLHIAANNDFTDMCKMLIDFGADVNCIYRNSKGVAMTPLDCSLQKGFRSTAKFLQSNSGLPASKLRLSGRHPNAFNEQELVKPLKYAEKEEVHDLKNQKKYIVYSKRSDSESSGCSCSEHWYKREHHVNHVCKHHRKRLRRRTSSCGEVDEIGNQDSCSDICRSKSNIEIRRKRSRERVYTSDEGDSCEVCCRHKRRLKSKRKERSQQRRYKEITYSEDDDDADRIRNQKRIEREKGKYSTKTDSKGNIYNESTVAKSESVEDAVDRSSPPLEKTQRPQSAKKRRQQSKEATFIKPEVLGDSIPVSGAFDLTDDDEIQKSELVVTQVQVHKEIEETSSPLPPTEQEAEMEDKTKTDESTEIAVEEISKEVNEVIKDATETVEKISENPLKDSKEELQESLVTEEKLEKIPVGETDTEKESDQPAAESATKPDSESLIDANISEKESSVPVETAVLEENIIKNASDAIPPELENTGESELKTVLSEQVEEKPQEEVKEMDSTENVKAEVTKTESLQDDVTEKETEVPTYADTAEISSKTDGEENVQVTETEADMQMPKLETEEIKADEKPDSIEINGKKEDEIEKEKFIEKTVQIAEKEENGLASEAAQVNLLTPIGREQESRRSFTLLPDSPVAASEIDEQQDELEESALRKSSFTVLKSDESVENYDIQNDEMLVNEKSSFQIVSSPEKKSTNNQASYSSEDAAEVDDEEDEEQQNLRTGVPGAIYVSNRDGRHSAMAGSISDGGSGRKKRLKRRVKSGGKGRGWRSVEVDEESPSGQQASRDQDSGFEPSPRATKTKLNTSYNSYGSFVPKKTIYATIDGRSCSSRIEGRKPGDKNSCNMTAVTKSIHRNIRRYYMERKIFQHLLELKSLQIRSSKLNEAVLVKRAVDDYHKSCIALGAETGGSLRRYPYTEYTFKNFEMFLYETLKSLQKPGTYNFQNINEVYEEAERRLSPDYNTYEKALQCTTKTHRCLHAAHAYTGIPCAAYIPMMNHHTMPKFGFGSYKKSGVGSFYLPKILTSPVKCGTSNTKTVISGSGGAGGTRVSLELSHGKTKQLISLPSEKLDSNKRYYVTFTVKGSGEGTVTGSPGKTKIELSSDGKVIQQTDVTPIEK
ncbi:ankycorbin [Condylostylus longicornis]|uniref:ankycorbin n=1 Tax=Condylostylus longicornis TaxID=2530218 RepID=UPI00244E4874|nr:ankycorbin [Condylostylus longicornis]